MLTTDDHLDKFRDPDTFAVRAYARAMATEHGYIDRSHLFDALLAGSHSELSGLILDAIDQAVRHRVIHRGRVRLPRAGLVDREVHGLLFPTVPYPLGRPLDLYDLAPEITARMFGQDFQTTTGSSDDGAVDDQDQRVDEFVWYALATLEAMCDTVPGDVPMWIPGYGWHGTPEAIAALESEVEADVELDEDDDAFDDDDVLEEWDAAIAEMRSASTSIWLLQCNPKYYDVLPHTGASGQLPDSWSIGRYTNDIQVGDRVVFWLSGKEAGAYALGVVTGEPFHDVVNDEVVSDEAGDRWNTFIPIDLTLDLRYAAVLRSDLKQDPRFASESIVRAPMAANPHPVSASAFDAILDLLED